MSFYDPDYTPKSQLPQQKKERGKEKFKEGQKQEPECKDLPIFGPNLESKLPQQNKDKPASKIEAQSSLKNQLSDQVKKPKKEQIKPPSECKDLPSVPNPMKSKAPQENKMGPSLKIEVQPKKEEYVEDKQKKEGKISPPVSPQRSRALIFPPPMSPMQPIQEVKQSDISDPKNNRSTRDRSSLDEPFEESPKIKSSSKETIPKIWQKDNFNPFEPLSFPIDVYQSELFPNPTRYLSGTKDSFSSTLCGAGDDIE